MKLLQSTAVIFAFSCFALSCAAYDRTKATNLIGLSREQVLTKLPHQDGGSIRWEFWPSGYGKCTLRGIDSGAYIEVLFKDGKVAMARDGDYCVYSSPHDHYEKWIDKNGVVFPQPPISQPKGEPEIPRTP